MAGPTPPIQPPRRSDQEKVRFSSPEAQREIHNKYFHMREEAKDKPAIPFAWFVSIVKKAFDYITNQKGKNILTKDAEAIRDDLKKLQQYLGRLKERDESENPLYIEKLSGIWDELYELTHKGALVEPKLLEAIDNLTAVFTTYPKDSIHSFHFYLIEHAGMSWFPFPFIEMLKSLHKEALQDPENCSLAQWIKIIEQSF